MSKRASRPDRNAYWPERVRSPAFRRSLARLVRRELHALASLRVKDVVDAAAIRRLIRTSPFDLVDRAVVADLVLAGTRGFDKHLRRQHRSVLEVVGRDLAEALDAFIEASFTLPPHAEEFVSELMEQEFARRLLTDVLFTAITAFYRRVNPLFGAVTTRVLEDQIKGFIGLVLPNLQRQAVAFATSRANQRILLEFSRAIVRQLLATRLSQYAGAVAAGNVDHAEKLLRAVVRSKKLDAAVRRAVAAIWDEVYAHAAPRKIGELIDVGPVAAWLTTGLLNGLEVALSRPDVARFIADEIRLSLGPRT